MQSLQIPADFDPDFYLELHPDVKNAGADPVKHYIEFGIKEGRAYKKTSSLENIFSTFLTLPPSAKNAFDLFPAAWSTIFDGMTQGHFDGTRDARIEWLFRQVDVTNFKIL